MSELSHLPSLISCPSSPLSPSLKPILTILSVLYYENHLNSTNESFPVSVTKDYASNMTLIQLSIFATFCTCVCAYLAFTVYKLAQPRPPVRRIARVASDLDQLPLKSAMSLKGRAMSFIFALTDASKDALVALNLRKSPPPSVVDTTSDGELISDTSDDSDTEDEMVFFITKRHRNRMVDVAEAEADHEHAQSVDD